MIIYRPTDGDVPPTTIPSRPKSCFLMTQLGEPVQDGVAQLRRKVETQLKKKKIQSLDADSDVTGNDFLEKIWKMIVSVPLGVAIIHEDMPPRTINNIFYELGMMDVLGKQTVVVKSPGASIPSDFVRTEYIEDGPTFPRKFGAFLSNFLGLADYYEELADGLEKNPLLSIDYMRRAYMVSGDARLKKAAVEIFDNMELKGRSKNSVEKLMIRF